MVKRQPLPPHAQKVFTGKLFSVYQWEQLLFDGSTATFEKITRADSAGVLAVTNRGTILLTRQEQPGINQFISLVGGIIDPGETPVIAVSRELLEETGYKAEGITEWFAVQPFSKIDWTIYMYIARGCVQVAEPQPDPGEKITVFEVGLDEFMEIIFREEFRDVSTTLHIAKMLLQPNGKLELARLLGLSSNA